jgi:CheY-like chemotaxis protein
MRIMFIDDDHRRMRKYVDALESNKHEVIFQENVDLALATLRDQREHWDMVVLDISMPPGKEFKFEDTIGGTRTGLPLYDMIRRVRPDLKIVAFTNVNVQDPRIAEHFRDEDDRLCRLVRKPENLPIQFAKLVKGFLAGTDNKDGS